MCIICKDDCRWGLGSGSDFYIVFDTLLHLNEPCIIIRSAYKFRKREHVKSEQFDRKIVQCVHRDFPGDILTPVRAFSSLRKFGPTLLLESTELNPDDHCLSYVCFNPIFTVEVRQGTLSYTTPDGGSAERALPYGREALTPLGELVSSFEVERSADFSSDVNGLFGYSSYEAVPYFEDIEVSENHVKPRKAPDLCYQLFQWIIGIDLFHNKVFIVENTLKDYATKKVSFEELKQALLGPYPHSAPFTYASEETSNVEDQTYLDMVRKGKEHVQRGDVFQLVLSRSFSGTFSGDEFRVYRALRLINPSPYLYFFDYGAFKIFGSSPEAQLQVFKNKAVVFPIAGTCKRGASPEEDEVYIEALKNDPKENSEHVMLVDLARNDLSRSCKEVHVEEFKTVHRYSHVSHLVSKVVGTTPPEARSLQILSDTFPAGTLTGAPKHRALQLINRYEPTSRGVYGGAIGFLGFDSSSNHAIIIRSFYCEGNTLTRQAGAGIVADSVPERELEEVNNKLRALKGALERAVGDSE